MASESLLLTKLQRYVTDGTRYPFDIPSNTAVPGWAYQLVEGANRFSMTEALAAKDEPEHKASTSSSLSSSSSTSTTTPNTTPSNTAPSSHASSNSTGAIVGGVVGGVASLAILGGLVVFFILHRRKSNRYTEISVASEDRFDNTNLKAYQQGEKGGSAASIQSTGAGASLPSWQGAKRPIQESYFNPYDPNTYPTKGAPDRSFSDDSYTLVGSNPPLGALGWEQHEVRAEV